MIEYGEYTDAEVDVLCKSLSECKSVPGPQLMSSTSIYGRSQQGQAIYALSRFIGPYEIRVI